MSVILNSLIFFYIGNWPGSRLIKKKKSTKKVRNVKDISNV